MAPMRVSKHFGQWLVSLGPAFQGVFRTLGRVAVRLTGCTADARKPASCAQPGIHSRLLNVHSRIVADRSIRYAGDDPTFLEQSAPIVPKVGSRSGENTA